MSYALKLPSNDFLSPRTAAISVGFLLFLSFCNLSAFANHAGVEWDGGIAGGQLVAVSATSITMESEDVQIVFDEDEQKVYAQFHMVNRSNTPQKILSGFPFESNAWDDETATHALKSFQVLSSYNGRHFSFIDPKFTKPVTVGDTYWYYNENQRRLNYDKMTSISLQMHPLQRRWAYWDTEFQPGQAIDIKINYTFPNNLESNLYFDKYMIYIARSGATWKPPIGKAAIVVHFPMHDLKSMSFFPAGYKIDPVARTVKWEFKNWTPDTDFYAGQSPVEGGFKQLDAFRKRDWEKSIRGVKNSSPHEIGG